jgi:hypothetical protein
VSLDLLSIVRPRLDLTVRQTILRRAIAEGPELLDLANLTTGLAWTF